MAVLISQCVLLSSCFVGGGSLDPIPSNVTLTSLNGGQIMAGGSTQKITWTADSPFLGPDAMKLEYSIDGGVTWTLIAQGLPNTGTYTWAVPKLDSSKVKIKVTATDTGKVSVSASSTAPFTVDSTPPALVAAQMLLDGGKATTGNNYVAIALKAADGLTNITHFCVKANDPTQPATTADPCWHAVDANPQPGLIPAQTLNLGVYNYFVGFTPGTYTIYAWVRDQVGNISTLTSAGTGTLGLDKAAISYAPKAPPTLINILATNTDAPGNPPTAPQLTVPKGTNVVVKWNVSAAPNFLGASPISLYYTLDDTNYTLIANNVLNAQGAGCTTDASHSGCYVWASTVPTGTYFKIRVSVQDTEGQVTVASSVPLNAPSMNFLAGSTDPGLGGSATAAMFFNNNNYWSSIASDSQTLVVTSSGRVFFSDYYRGLLSVDPSDGVQRLLIPITGVLTDGALASATLVTQPRIALDYQDRVLVYDNDRIRRIDLTANTITTIIGGGSATADGTAATAFKITPTAFSSFFVLPNGDIYFSEDTGTIPPNPIRVFHASTGLMSSITLSGTGVAGDPTLPIANLYRTKFGLIFDPATSNVTTLVVSVWKPVTGGAIPYLATFDPKTGISLGASGTQLPQFSSYEDYTVHRGTGAIYGFARGAAKLVQYNSGTNSWTTILGSGTIGVCPDGTPALSCNLEVHDVFIAQNGQIYFVDRGRVRAIDGNGNVITLLGQPFYFGDGGLPTSARFNMISAIDQDNAGNFYTLDRWEHRLRKFTVGGLIQTIAGNGTNSASPDTINPANTQPISAGYWGANYLFNVDPSNGDVYYSRATSSWMLSRLDHVSGKWVDVAGTGASSLYSSDGLLGNQIVFDASYPPWIFGFNGTQCAVSFNQWNPTVGMLNSVFKLYSTTNGTQSPLAGVVATATNAFSADGTALASTQVPVSLSGANLKAFWDSANSRWLMGVNGSSAIRTLPPGGSIGTLVNLPRPVQAFTYVLNASSQPVVYYCGSDGKVYKYNVTTATETALPWPISSISCQGPAVLRNTTRGSVVFPFVQNHLSGVAEIVDTP